MPGATSPKRTVQTSGRGTLICPYFGKSLSDPIFKQLSSETFFVLSSWLTHTVRHCSFILGRKDPRAWGKSWNLSFQRYSRRPTESWRQSRVPFHVGLGFHWRPRYWQSESRRNFPRWNPPLPWHRGASHQRRIGMCRVDSSRNGIVVGAGNAACRVYCAAARHQLPGQFNN